MSEIQVLRIENADGVGIFTSGFLFRSCRAVEVRHCENFRNPQSDGLNLYKDKWEWFCAYKSIEQIQQWIFPDEFEVIINGGFRVFILTVSNYQIGEDQVIFTKEHVVSRRDVTELFKLS